MDRESAAALAGKGVSLAAENARNRVVFSGPEGAILELERELGARGVRCRPVNDRFGFHSELMEPVLADFARELGNVRFDAPSTPVISSRDAQWIDSERPLDASHLCAQTRGPVEFRRCIETVLQEGRPVVFLEIGEGRLLTGLVEQIAEEAGEGGRTHVAPLGAPDGTGDSTADGRERSLLGAVARSWECGLPVQWPPPTRRIPLPGYAFERVRCWPVAAAETSRDARAGLTADRPSGASPAWGDEAPAEVIARIWAEALGLRTVGPDDDYFALGGDSLVALGVAARIGRELGVRLAPEALASHPTPSTLAAHLRESPLRTPGQEDASPERPAAASVASHPPARPAAPDDPGELVVQLAPSASRKPPVFAVHPAGGSVFCYRPLASRIAADRRLLGIRAAQDCRESERVATIEGLARRYCEAVKAHQPHGPYLLAGYSFGGNVAFEMATRLQQLGERVQALVLFDSHPPACYAGEVPDDDAYERVLPHLACLALGIDLEQLEPGARTWEGIHGLLRVASGLPESALQGEDPARFLAVWKNNHRALKLHRPTAVFDGPIVYFEAREPQPEIIREIHIRVEPGVAEEGWGPLAGGGLRRIETPGNHYDLLSERHGDLVAQRLLAELRRSEPVLGDLTPRPEVPSGSQ